MKNNSAPASAPFPRRSPTWQVTPTEDRDHYRYEIREALEKGTIPAELFEEMNWVRPDDQPEAARVIAYIRTILDRLSMATHGTPHPEMRVFLSDTAGVNTGILPAANPPILVVGVGLLDLLEAEGLGEDHLAAVLSHERFHLLRHDKWPGLDNGRPEETAADIFAVHETNKAGYNPAAASEVFSMLLRRGGRMDRANHLYHILDEHPATEDRVRNTQIALAHLQLTQRMDSKAIPFPADITTANRAVKYRTDFDRYAAPRGYDGATLSAKLHLIHAYVQDVLETRHIIEKYSRKKRVFPQHLSGIRLATTLAPLTELARADGPAFRKAMMPHLRSLMMWSEPEANRWHERDRATHVQWMTRTYARLYHYAGLPEADKAEHSFSIIPDASGLRVDLREERNGWNSRSKEFHAILPPVFQCLETGAADFLTAGTKDEALRIAARYAAAEKLLSRYENGLDVLDMQPRKPEWPYRGAIRRALETDGVARLPWANIVRFIDDETTTDHEKDTLRNLALHLGCTDPRLTGRPTQIGYHSDKYDFADLAFDADGNITGLALSEEEKMQVFRDRYKQDSAAAFFDNEAKEIARRTNAELSALATVDWTDMDKDFKGFIERYADLLEPVYSILPTPAPFAAAFLHALDSRAKTGPGWAAKRDWFISGRTQKGSKKSRADRYGDEDGASKAMEWSLPDLLRRSSEKYFGYAGFIDVFDHRYKGRRGTLPDGHPHARRLAALPDTREARSDYKYDYTTGTGRYINRKPPKVTADKQEVTLDIGLDPRHPYVKPLLRAPDALIHAGKKNNLLSHVRHRDGNAASLPAHTRLSLRPVFNYHALGSARGFDRVHDHIHGYSMNGRQYSAWDNTGAKEIELLRTLRRLNRGQPRRFNFEEMSALTVTSEFYNLHNKSLAAALQGELATLVERQVRRNAAIDLSRKTPLATLVRRYCAMRGENEGRRGRYGVTRYNAFFTRPKLEQRYTDAILKRIRRLKPQQQIAPLNAFLAVQVKDPSRRRVAIDLWVDAQAAVLGPDTATPDYKAAAMKIITAAMSKLEGSQAMSCIIRLLDRVEAQQDVALAAKSSMVDRFGAQFLSSDIRMRTIESAVETCARHPALRAAFLTYITDPLTEAGTRKFAQALKTYGYDRYENEGGFIRQFYNPEKHLSLPPTQERMVVDYLHKNFWDAPFELRTVYLDRILFPTHAAADDGNERFTAAVDYVLDKVLPLDRKFAAEAREALRVYLDQCPQELRRTTFSAILATSQENGGDHSLRPGQVLSYVLTRTGAAGGQLLQAGHSYLGGLDITDPDLARFRDDLKDSKVNFAPPFRWEVFERINTVLTPEERSTIARVGPVLGSGSTAYVVGCARTDGRNTALKLMRPQVRDIADLHFERYGAAFDILAARHAMYAPLPAMLRHAQDTTRTATDGAIAAQQVEYAQKIYDGLQITVNGSTFDFNVAGYVRHGAEFLETTRIDGRHLNDFDTGDPQKFALAVAIETAELYRMLQGKAIDEDRHGGQQKSIDGRIGIFDVGALPYDRAAAQIRTPNDTQKTALGQVIGHMANAVASGQSPIETLIAQVTGHDWDGAKDYLVGIKRGLLARTDAHSAFGATPTDRAAVHGAIFAAILRTGQIDPAIASGIAKTLRPAAALQLAGGHLQKILPHGHMPGKAGASPLDIAIHDGSQTPRIAPPDFGKLARDYAQAALVHEIKTAAATAQSREGLNIRAAANSGQTATKWHAARTALRHLTRKR